VDRIRAWAVHVLTACGAALALMALIFATGGHWEAMFFCLGLALIVDGVDGPLGFGVRRATFLIDPARFIRGALLADFRISQHVNFIHRALAMSSR